MPDTPPLSRHPIAECDRLLRAFDGFDPHRCQPLQWMCECGRAWVHICDEAEGCFYWHAENHDAVMEASHAS